MLPKFVTWTNLIRFSYSTARSCDFALNGIFNDEFIESEMEKVIGSPTRSSLRSSTPQNPSLGATPKLSSFERNPFNTKLRLAERFDLFGFNDTHKSEPSFEFEKCSSISPAISPPLEIGSGDSVSKPLYSLGEMKDPTEPPTLAVQFEDLKMEDYSSEMAGKVRFLINKVLDLKEAAYFISPTMAKDYVCF